jgi:hypothetical protein
MNIKIFCHCSLFPSWSGYGFISIPVQCALAPHVRPRILTPNVDSEFSEIDEETHVKLKNITDNLFEIWTKYFTRSCKHHPSLLTFQMERHVGQP